jgi:predicted ATP-dependent protease
VLFRSLIPQSNVQNLMLREDVVEAIKKGKFHIYSVSHVDEGIEILTGMKAGKRLKDGTFEKNSINRRVQSRLEELAKGMKEFEKKDEEKKRKENNNKASSNKK